ncbi:MAG: hypothetical protein WAV89_12240 [Ignavibacteriaceae bacterium]
MKKILFARFVFIFVITLLVVSCSSKKDYLTPEDTINANAEYLNKEDLDGAMSTIHPESPDYEGTKELTEKILERYDLSYKIEDIKVIEENDNEAKVRFTQVVKKIKGPEFKDNRTTGIHTLKKDGDSWKIYSTEMVKVEFLNKDEAKN